MKVNRFLAILATCMVLFTACQPAAEPTATTTEPAAAAAPAEPDMVQIRAEIQAAETAWAAALNARDVNALMALYTDDAVSMGDDAPMLVGKAAIQAAQEAEFKTLPAGQTFTFETMDIYGDGDIVTETGKSIYKDAAGKVTGTGKYMAIFKKQDGKYLCIREIYNSDKE